MYQRESLGISNYQYEILAVRYVNYLPMIDSDILDLQIPQPTSMWKNMISVATILNHPGVKDMPGLVRPRVVAIRSSEMHETLHARYCRPPCPKSLQ